MLMPPSPSPKGCIIRRTSVRGSRYFYNAPDCRDPEAQAAASRESVCMAGYGHAPSGRQSNANSQWPVTITASLTNNPPDGKMSQPKVRQAT